ncbi:E3 ubiquitin-protein ligase TRIM65-like [Centropristis striata]|uniref:E3 ubiquitin-protein ligase TRIM65-like n=1 Tax=Centropristis striata TaxID=184440 RepID=UPI0027E1E5BC|nr:E3 ubiquitin-protein ligase TRIM65-like [Centropristis striata]
MACSKELFNCSICLDLLKEPVRITCGHSYCKKCISAYWDTNKRKRDTDRYSCPQCREPFSPRTGEEHTLKKHNLIQASSRIKESICVRHDKLLEIFCRTDQQFICLLCRMEEHRGHDTVTVAAEQRAKQIELDWTQQEIADRVLNSKAKIAELKQAADSIRDAAYEACDDFEQLCEEHIRSVEKKCSEMREKIGGAEKAGLDRTNSRLKKLEREVLELTRQKNKRNQLLLTDDPIQFLQGFQALGDLPESTHSHERRDLTEFVSAQTDKLKNMCNKEKKELFSHSENNKVSLPVLKTTSRKYHLTKHKDSTVEVDPNTIAACLCLSNRNREMSWGETSQAHPDHPARFTVYPQALCKNKLTYSHYWEVEWDGGSVDLAVSYKRIERKGSGNYCRFGHNKISWKLTCTSSGCTFWHNNLHKGQIPPVLSRRVGIHLEYDEGTLSFYSVSDSDTLKVLHQIRTTFTEPLYPGFSVDLGSTLKICNI